MTDNNKSSTDDGFMKVSYRMIFVTACFADLSLWDVEWVKSAPLNVEVKSEITETVEGTALTLT